MYDLLEVMNPHMRHRMSEHFYYKQIKEYDTFKNLESAEVMYMLVLMKTELSIAHE